MTKKEVIDAVAEELGVSKAYAENAIFVVLDTVIGAARRNGQCAIAPHKFIKKTRSARKGRNPSTGEVIDVPARDYIVYKEIKDRRK